MEKSKEKETLIGIDLKNTPCHKALTELLAAVENGDNSVKTYQKLCFCWMRIARMAKNAAIQKINDAKNTDHGLLAAYIRACQKLEDESKREYANTFCLN